MQPFSKKFHQKFGKYKYILYICTRFYNNYYIDNTNNTKNNKTMKKKIYATPDLSVVEYEMTIITETSFNKATRVGGNIFNEEITGGTEEARGKQRNGIWDED